MPVKLKVQDWSVFDNILEELSNGHEDKDIPLDIKEALKGSDVMTDKQHKCIVAIFTNELDWNPDVAFRFILKTIPDVRTRLKKRVLHEYDLSGLYQEIKKKEAIKLINVLRVVSRNNKNKS